MPKPSKVTELGCAFVLGLSLSMLSQTSLAANEDVLVTDPDTLEAMGFERDAENVYMAPGLDLGSGFESGLAPAVDLEAQTSLLSSSGTTGYATVSPSKFSGTVDRPGEEWAYTTGGSDALSRQGPARFADAQVDGLPHGGILEFLGWWWRDFDPASVMAIFLFEVCTSPSAGTFSGLPTVTTIASDTSADDPVRFRSISIPSRPIDTFRCFYSVRVRFDEATTSLVFVKARLRFIHP